MATSYVSGPSSDLVEITSQTNAQSGHIYLIRTGAVRQLEFVEAKTPSDAPHFSLPTMDESDRPRVTTEANLRKSNHANHAIWIRVAGTFGQANGEPGVTVNGTLTWIV